MSFIDDYLAFSTGNECPRQFHVWAGYFVLSSAIRRQTWLPHQDTEIYPNIYILYVGSAGNGKSWAMRPAKRMLDLLGISGSASVETPQGLWRFIGGDPNAKEPVPSPVMQLVKGPKDVLLQTHPMPIIANEFINYISMAPEEWVSALNDIYDGDDYVYRTKNQGTDTLHNPYITMLGALTTSVAADLHKKNIIASGLARRTFFQFGEREWNNPHPYPIHNDDTKAAYARCLAHLKEMQKVCKGGFILDDDARDWWTTWYTGFLPTVPTRPLRMQGWYASRSVQVQKLAMLNSLSDRMDMKITVRDFTKADESLEVLERDLYRIFGGVGRNELSAVSIKLFECIAALPHVSEKSRIHHNYFDLWDKNNSHRECDECVAYLLNQGKLAEFSVQGVGPSGGTMKAFIGTPEQVAAYAASAPPHVAAALIASLQAAARATDPSLSPTANPPNATLASPVVAPPADGTAT